MHILLTNDDGYEAEGIRKLYAALSQIACVTIVAPNANKSAIGHGITIFKDIMTKKISEGIFAVDGTPADCVRLALNCLVKEKIDLVVAGINHGPNLGFDVFYSGTAAAAREASIRGIPSIAVSVCDPKDPRFDNACIFMQRLVQRHANLPLHPDVFLNVNVPNCEMIKGIEVTRLSRKHYHDSFSDRGDGKYCFGFGLWKDDFDPGTDIASIVKKKISISPLGLDMTCPVTIQFADEIKESILRL